MTKRNSKTTAAQGTSGIARYAADLERNLCGRSTVYGQTAEQTAGAVRACIESCDAQIAEKAAWIATLRARIPTP